MKNNNCLVKWDSITSTICSRFCWAFFVFLALFRSCYNELLAWTLIFCFMCSEWAICQLYHGDRDITWLQTNKSSFIFSNAVCLVETTDTNVIVFGLTRLEHAEGLACLSLLSEFCKLHHCYQNYIREENLDRQSEVKPRSWVGVFIQHQVGFLVLIGNYLFFWI